MKKLAIAMAKGGVGKTTTAVNLAHGLAEKGKKVLLIDCDTQDQAAKFLGVKPDYGLHEFITGHTLTGEAVHKQDVIFPARKNLWLVSGGLGIAELKNWLGEQPADTRQSILKDKLVPKEGMLDYMIFDCAPGWDILSVNILMTTEDVLCPVSLQGPAVEGLKTYLGYIAAAQKSNPDLTLKYILPTMFDKRTKQSHEILAQLKETFKEQICSPIRYNVRLSEAPAHGQTIFEYSKQAAGAADYEKLIKRIKKDG